MRKIYLIILIIFNFYNQLFSQQYQKIPIDSNYYWRQISAGGYQYQIKYSKDTLISGKTYNKYSQFGMSLGSNFSQTFNRHGFLRQDTINKKVFILDTTFLEHPLYDFNKAIGDTMLVYDKISNTNVTYTVTHDYGTILEINHNGNPRFIEEGVGALTEGLYGPNAANDSVREVLICFGKINPFTKIEWGTFISFQNMCFIITDVNSNGDTKYNPINIFPNPIKNLLTIEFENNFHENSLTIYNSFGQPVYKITSSDEKLIIDFSSLTFGIYFLEIKNSTGNKHLKIIKE